jgi:hypothetical protein
MTMKDEQDTQTPDMLASLPTPGFRERPPMVGWWEVRRVEHLSAEFTTRRWWDGSHFSIPCPIGASDGFAEEARQTRSLNRPECFEWRGRFEPDLSYPYLLRAATNEEAFSLTAEELEGQALCLRLAYGPEAEEKLQRERDDSEDVPEKPLAWRRNFNYD